MAGELMGTRGTYTVTPSAARLSESLRDIGYEFTTAVADLVDNSVTAGARQVDIVVGDEASDPYLLIADDGSGMSASQINEALRFGSRSSYGPGALGRYGLGLKTASLSQCRSVTVMSRRAAGAGRVAVRQLDLDLVAQWDEWLIVDPGSTDAVKIGHDALRGQMNTVVLWERLDRLLPGHRDSGWSKRRLRTARDRLRGHLAMVFHRFLSGEVGGGLTITVDGEKVAPWDPFARDEPATMQLPMNTFEVPVGEMSGKVTLHRWVLPPRQEFSQPDAFERHAGPLKWNRQQGLYIYRAGRLVQWGGWAGLRAIDEHTKLARAAVDFDTDLDVAFAVNVAKMRVALPPEVRQLLSPSVSELCQRAQATYRVGTVTSGQTNSKKPRSTPSGVDVGASETGMALLSAAVQSGQYEALRQIAAALRRDAPDLAAGLGLDTLV